MRLEQCLPARVSQAQSHPIPGHGRTGLSAPQALDRIPETVVDTLTRVDSRQSPLDIVVAQTTGRPLYWIRIPVVRECR